MSATIHTLSRSCRTSGAEQLLELAIELQDLRGRRAAGQFLHERGLPFALIVRVLSEPARRRRAARAAGP